MVETGHRLSGASGRPAATHPAAWRLCIDLAAPTPGRASAERRRVNHDATHHPDQCAWRRVVAPDSRLGAGRAAALVRWLQAYAASLGELDPDALCPSTPHAGLVLLAPERLVFVPFERISLPAALCGADGRNRNHAFCLIAAGNDLEAIEAYLYKFRAQDKTRRAYQKELERFLLWCVYVRRQPLSSTLLEDCEAYKNFLADPPAFWIGPRALRMGPRWKPFAGRPSASSQRYAVQVIRTFFSWLVDVRYLGGNPWVAARRSSCHRAPTPDADRKSITDGALGKIDRNTG